MRFGKEPVDGSCPLADFENEDGGPEAPPAISTPAPAPTEAPETTEAETVPETEPPSTTGAPTEGQQEQTATLEVLLEEGRIGAMTTQKPVTCAELKCQHGTRCQERHFGEAFCDCKGSGYVGTLCQFCKSCYLLVFSS